MPQKRRGRPPGIKAQEDSEDNFEVEAVLGERTRSNGIKEYYIKWLNYPDSDNTWEPMEHLEGCHAHLNKFAEEQKAVTAANNYALSKLSPKARKAIDDVNKMFRTPPAVQLLRDGDDDLELSRTPGSSKASVIPKRTVTIYKARPARDIDEELGFDGSDDDGYKPTASKRSPPKKVDTIVKRKPEAEPAEEIRTGPIKKSDQGEFWEVEEVIGAFLSKGKITFLVKWKSWPEAENTWEPASCLKGSPLAVSEFYNENGKPTAGNPKVLSDKGRRYEELYGGTA